MKHLSLPDAEHFLAKITQMPLPLTKGKGACVPLSFKGEGDSAEHTLAKIDKMPSMAIIDGFKGTLDYYVHDGVPCARAWPRKATYQRSEKELATQLPFAWAAANWINLSASSKEAWNNMAVGSPTTGREIFIRSVISGDTIVLM